MMKKNKIKKDFWPFVESVVIVGTESANKKPNFITCSWHSRVNQKPPQWGITIDHRRYSLSSIKQNMTFSINYPGKELVKETDYCGIYSGRKVDKSSLFTIFKGTLNGAPMIEECIVNIELQVKKIIELESDCLIIGEIINTYSDERYIVDNGLDFEKADSFFLTYPDFNYHTIHEYIGKAWQIGKRLD
jgi:flavin reductase (DIM6/NTAB) family NADH-FMN oxidoreductase RutF